MLQPPAAVPCPPTRAKGIGQHADVRLLAIPLSALGALGAQLSAGHSRARCYTRFGLVWQHGSASYRNRVQPHVTTRFTSREKVL